MSAHAFYRAERERWPELHSIFISERWAQRALKKLVRHFKLDEMPYGNGPVKLEFKGRTWSWGGRHGITLCAERDWLMFLHEVAHVFEARKFGGTFHRRRMVKIVDRLCRYAVKMGWPQLDLDEQFEAWAQTQTEPDPFYVRQLDPPESFGPVIVRPPDRVGHSLNAEERAQLGRAAKGPQTAQKLDHKRAQLKRLERKIKNLTTRAKKVRRSIGRLERALAVV